MTKTALRKSLRKLPLTDRIEMLDELWHSVAAEQAELEVPLWQREMIDQQLAEIEAHPGEGIPLREFQKKIDAAVQRLGGRRKQKR